MKVPRLVWESPRQPLQDPRPPHRTRGSRGDRGSLLLLVPFGKNKTNHTKRFRDHSGFTERPRERTGSHAQSRGCAYASAVPARPRGRRGRQIEARGPGGPRGAGRLPSAPRGGPAAGGGLLPGGRGRACRIPVDLGLEGWLMGHFSLHPTFLGLFYLRRTLAFIKQTSNLIPHLLEICCAGVRVRRTPVYKPVSRRLNEAVLLCSDGNF